MKRIVTFLLAISLVLGLSACGKEIIVNISSKGTSVSEQSGSSDIISSDTPSKAPSSSESDESISRPSSQTPSSSVIENTSSDIPAVALPMTMEELVADLNSWNMKLVNRDNPLPVGFSISKTKIKSAYARDYGMLYDSRAVSYLNAMCAAAAKDGVNLLVISSFRTHERQTTLYNNQVEKQRKKYPNKSEDELKQIAGTISALPGTSEHELGLAVDFNSVEESFENTKQFKWLQENAADYGFIMRYAKEKQSITGVIYEPWHYRYVGVGHAKKIKELGICFEEYVEYLKNYKQ